MAGVYHGLKNSKNLVFTIGDSRDRRVEDGDTVKIGQAIFGCG
jgi:hypothetical protein